MSEAALLSDSDVGLAGPQVPAARAGALLSDEDMGIQQPSTMSSVAASIPIGANRMLAKTLGAPGDLGNWQTNLFPRAANAVFGTNFRTDYEPFGQGAEGMNKMLGVIGANPEAPEHKARSQLERVLQVGGEGAAAMILPEMGIAGAARMGVSAGPEIGEAMSSAFGSAKSAPAVLKNAAVGVGSAATGEAAAQQFPDDPTWQTGARLAGSLVGGVGAAGLTSPGAVLQAGKRFVAPMYKAGQERLAGQTLADAATNRVGTMDALDNAPQQIVPGSKPTTFQQTGDMGLGSLERQVATQNPAEFNARRAEQNQARVEALGNIQATGTPEDVSAHLRGRLDALDAQAGDIQATAANRAQQAATGLGGNQSPGYYGEAIRGEVEPQVRAATENAAAQTSALGGTGTPEGFGEALRTPYQERTESLRRQRNDLYDAIDPDNSLNVVASPLRDASAELYAGQSKLAAPPAGEEAAIQAAIHKLPDVVPFNDLRALDSRITAARAAERAAAGESPVWGRLTQLKNAVSGTIDNGVANQVAYERAAVARGELNPDDVVEARVGQWVTTHNEQQDAIAASRVGASGNSTSGIAGASGSFGTARQAGKSAAGNAGVAGVPPETLSPNFDPAAAQRLAAAKQANIALQANKKGPLGAIIKTDGFGRPIMPNSSVPGAVFAKGPGGFEKAMAYRKAVNNDPAAISAMQNYAAASLRKAAERPDGTLDPGKFSTWKAAHAEAMRAFPELMQRFSTAAKASEALTRFAPFRADMAPSALPEMFFHSGPSGAEGVANLRRLIGDAKASAILQDYAASKLKSVASNADGTLDPGRVARFQQTHAEALKAFPALNDKFSSAAKAQQTVEAVAKARKAGLDAYQAGAIGRIIKAEPEDVTKHIGAIFGARDSVAQMGRLAREAASDKTGAATEGLRKAIADHIYSKFISNTEAGTSGSNLVKSDGFQTFMRQNRAALSKVFKPDEIASMDAIAADLHRANRSVTAVKLPGQSNTAQDLSAVEKASHGKQEPLLREIVEGAVTGHIGAGPVGAVAGGLAAVGKHIAGAMRLAGYAKVDDLVKDALLNPDLAKALLMKAPMRSGRGSDITLLHQLSRLSMFSAANNLAHAQNGNVPERAAGGRIGSYADGGQTPFADGDPFASHPNGASDTAKAYAAALSASSPDQNSTTGGSSFLPSPSSNDTLRPYNPSWSEKLGAATQDTLEGMGLSRGNAQEAGQRMQSAAGVVPFVGNALSGNNAYRDYESGNLVGAGLNTLAAVPIPGASIVEKMGVKAAERAVAGGSVAAADEIARMARARALGEGITAYHGSPHSFDKFDTSAIGTGEGAQAYGHGLYMAESEGVAKTYKSAGPAANAQYDAINARLSQLAKEMDANSYGYRNFKDKALGAQQASEYDSLMENKSNIGSMYQVNIAANPDHFLDWDKPLSEQHPVVQQGIAPHYPQPTVSSIGRPDLADVKVGGGVVGTFYRSEIPTDLDALKTFAMQHDPRSGENLYRMVAKNSAAEEQARNPNFNVFSPHDASQSLKDAGIPGIKYLDAGSRASGNGSRNYVVFDANTINILKKYGIAGLGAAFGGQAIMHPPGQGPTILQNGNVQQRARGGAVRGYAGGGTAFAGVPDAPLAQDDATLGLYTGAPDEGSHLQAVADAAPGPFSQNVEDQRGSDLPMAQQYVPPPNYVRPEGHVPDPKKYREAMAALAASMGNNQASGHF